MILNDLMQGISTESTLAGAAALLTGGIALLRWLLQQAERRLDERFTTMEDSRRAAQQQWIDQFSSLNQHARQSELRFAQLLADLPLQYQRREDAIRQEVAVIARLDALARDVGRALSCELKTCPIHDVLEHHHERH